MSTETEFQIREVEYDGITTWYAFGKVDEQQFLLALLEQFNESLTTRVKDVCRVPKLSDVAHKFGMATTCMDDMWCDAELHSEICEDPDTCDFALGECKWVTLIDDDSLYLQDETP